MQWLQFNFKYLVTFLLYRWILMIYFVSWQVTALFQTCLSKYFIELSSWTFLVFNCYLVVAALSATVKSFVRRYGIASKFLHISSHNYDLRTTPPAGLCGYYDNDIAWYQVLHWILFLLGTEMSFIGLVIFWILGYDQHVWDGMQTHIHLVGPIMALLDFWICGIPVNFFHTIYPMIFGALYFVYTGIYYVTMGEIVYFYLDYDVNFPLAVSVAFIAVLVVIPFVHCLFLIQYKLKALILSRLKN